MNFYGEKECQKKILSGKNKGKQCTNLAYYEKDDMLLCGMHAKKPRNELPKNPNKKEIEKQKIEKHNKSIEEAKEYNKKHNKKGSIIVTKLYMMKQAETIDGYIKVYPNYKHQNKKDGFGCASLSPKSLGPIIHNMPGLPPAKNLENYHQFSKFFPFEVKDNIITEKALLYRNQGFLDPMPHRHKFSKKELQKYNNTHIPLFSMYYDTNGKEHRYTYIECRYFYCYWYEKLAIQTKDFQYLLSIIEKGYNIQIIGYDGYQPNNNTIYKHYLDDSRPFGHELVLYSLLYIKNSKDYPWNIYYEKHKDIYKNVI